MVQRQCQADMVTEWLLSRISLISSKKSGLAILLRPVFFWLSTNFLYCCFRFCHFWLHCSSVTPGILVCCWSAKATSFQSVVFFCHLVCQPIISRFHCLKQMLCSCRFPQFRPCADTGRLTCRQKMLESTFSVQSHVLALGLNMTQNVHNICVAFSWCKSQQAPKHNFYHYHNNMANKQDSTFDWHQSLSIISGVTRIWRQGGIKSS